jgi:hypothetical protein
LTEIHLCPACSYHEISQVAAAPIPVRLRGGCYHWEGSDTGGGRRAVEWKCQLQHCEWGAWLQLQNVSILLGNDGSVGLLPVSAKGRSHTIRKNRTAHHHRRHRYASMASGDAPTRAFNPTGHTDHPAGKTTLEATSPLVGSIEPLLLLHAAPHLAIAQHLAWAVAARELPLSPDLVEAVGLLDVGDFQSFDISRTRTMRAETDQALRLRATTSDTGGTGGLNRSSCLPSRSVGRALDRVVERCVDSCPNRRARCHLGWGLCMRACVHHVMMFVCMSLYVCTSYIVIDSTIVVMCVQIRWCCMSRDVNTCSCPTIAIVGLHGRLWRRACWWPALVQQRRGAAEVAAQTRARVRGLSRPNASRVRADLAEALLCM